MLSFATVLALSSSVVATCYFPNGAVVDSDTACNPNAIESACCYNNQACLSNGLCVSDPHDAAKARLHRGTCTDEAWKSGNCPRQCLDINNNGVPVYSCNITNVDSYCCYDDCECASPFEVFSFSAAPSDVYTLTIIGESFTQTHVSTTSHASSSTTTAASSATNSIATSAVTALASATQSSSASAAANTESKSTNTTALGAGLGVGIPALAALFVGAFFLWRRKKRNATVTPESPTESHEHYQPQVKYAHYTDSEVHGDLAVNELAADQPRPIELPAWGNSGAVAKSSEKLV
ncbi:hypothetical protein T440DRAFT_411935 [Plenodomus tracheiphilus IPT5]|uniref:Mid2 domain-containing protein n=1 Tax=Plenodomus tracheiphilus IPT5 TaxID=1408161 RepID=A0A6A7BN40_9PLEO|nr:hypothetical protein T440DRAFT_411935 [Plenodomus tracheiphilus IPT5]